MKKFEFALSLLSICVLASCNTIVGVGKDLQDTVDYANNRPSELGQHIGDAPAGYREQPVKKLEYPDNAQSTENAQPADETQTVETSPAPPARFARRPVSAARNRLVWNKVDNYNAANPSLPDGQAVTPAPQTTMKTAANGEQIVQYGRDVQVFPVNGDVSPYTEVNAVHGGYINGELVQQVFFAHGSATVGKIDRKNIHELAQSLVHNKKGDYKIDIVGHASHRVNHIHDPIQKKMINFKIAQRRANAVASELLKSGVSPSWVVASSMGDEQPNPRRNGKSQEAADRRAEVYLSNE